MYKEKKRVTCLIFQKQEPLIRELADKINKAREPKEKIGHAQELQKQTGVLLMCPEYKETNLDCKSCRTITGLRKATAELIIKTKSLV